MYNASHRIADITISRLLGTPIIPAVPLTFGQMWSQPMISSAHLDSTAPAPYRNSLVVVGNPIYLLINNAVCLIPTSIIIIYWSVACIHIPFRKQFFRFCSCDRSISLYFAKCMNAHFFSGTIAGRGQPHRQVSRPALLAYSQSLEPWSSQVLLLLFHAKPVLKFRLLLLQDATRRALARPTLPPRTSLYLARCLW